MGQSSGDTLSLYLNKVFLGTLPTKCSRHNTPSRCHALTKVVKTCSSQSAKQTIVIVCEKRDVFASGCAVARAFPTFSRKTVGSSTLKNVSSIYLKFSYKMYCFRAFFDSIQVVNHSGYCNQLDSDSKMLLLWVWRLQSHNRCLMGSNNGISCGELRYSETCQTKVLVN